MIEPLARAKALTELLASPGSQSVDQSVAEAAVACCAELVECGEFQRALQLIQSSADVAEQAGKDWRLRLEVIKVRALRLSGSFGESLELSQRLLSGEQDSLRRLPHLSYELRINEAGTLTLLNRASDARELLSGIRKELLNGPDSALLASCAFNLGSAEMYRGDLAAAKRCLLEAIVSARRSGAELTEAIALDNLGRVERANCRWSAAVECGEEALRILERRPNRFYENNTSRSVAISHWKLGHLEKALEKATWCMENASQAGDHVMAWYATLLVGLIHVHRGSYEAAADFMRRDPAWQIPRSHSRPSLLTTEFLGDIHLEQGEADAALKYYDEVWPKAMALVPKGDIVAELRRRRAEVYYLQGRFEDAHTEAMGGLDHCRELGDRYEEAATYRVLALAAAALDRHDEARRWFDQGFAYYDDIETPFEWGKLWLSYGDWLRGPHAGSYADRVGALEAYHAARDHFERMGARAKLALANHRIAEMIAEDARNDDGAPGLSLRDADGPRHAKRRPPGSAELDRRSDWARQTFGLVTRSKQVLHMLDDVAKLSASRTPILILGESGTGKELVAGGLHRLSGRKGAFVPVNCGALPREIIESELFGHTAGSFTGATRDKAGLVEVCDGGTIFLDEIAEMTLESQSRFLRFLETGESRRVGSTRNVAVDTRIVAATNRDRHSLENGEGFRPDLYYRLAHAVVTLPPLRQRGEDIDLLIEHFLAEICDEEDREVTLSDGALKRLRKHPWPGNVRQLRSVIKRTVLLATQGEVVREALLQLDDGTSTPANLLEEMEHAERHRLRDALSAARGSRTEAARALGIPRTTFINKMKRFGLR
jgi:transcriptional regulator with AAA-type ATPase domain/tetratricopeptide (TPR) repeat protein